MSITDKILWHLGCYLKRDKHNPYTYYCIRCGQKFNTFGILGCSHHDTIEPVGNIKDNNCKCQKG